ncbi:MAG: YdeI/OmpD-associated family protein [Pseudomonadota bacterium]
MADWVSFEARVAPMIWGKNIYTILPIPDHIATALHDQGVRRVEIELNDHPFNLALTKAPVFDGTFVYTGKALLKQAGIEPDESLDVRLRPANPDELDVPVDVVNAVQFGGVSAAWASLTVGRKRRLLHEINQAKRPETRQRRVEKLIAVLLEFEPKGDNRTRKKRH